MLALENNTINVLHCLNRYHFKHLPPGKYEVRSRARTKPEASCEQKCKPSSDQKIKDLWCRYCGAEYTKEWRKGPYGPKTLCNACGIQYSKMIADELALQPSNNLQKMDLSFILNPEGKQAHHIQLSTTPQI